MVEGSPITTVLGKLIDESVEGLRWCKAHPGEREALVRLQRLQISLAAVALALDYEMEGEQTKALQAVEHADWTRRRAGFDPYAFGSHT
jgi:ABC-type nitrate/sulfonate/bicarbonate transport system substrate-binding protein